MKNPRRLSVLLIFAGLITLPWGCMKSFSSLPAAPGSAPPTPTETFQFSPTSTSTANPAFTFTNTPTITNSPTPSFTPASTPTLVDINFTSGVTVLPTGAYQFGNVHLGAGAVVTIAGAVTVLCKSFTLDAGATVTGAGQGYWGTDYLPLTITWIGPGPGWGASSPWPSSDLWFLCGGGGHGGAGGTDCDSQGNCVSGGKANDDLIHPSLMGSGGAQDSLNSKLAPPCSAGGGLLVLVAYDAVSNQVQPVTINGTVDMSGGKGCGTDFNGGDAGGAGGGILIEASSVQGNGYLNANGGNDGQINGGGGGGGIISLIEKVPSFAGTTSVLGGNYVPGYVSPNTGETGSVTVTAAPSSGY